MDRVDLYYVVVERNRSPSIPSTPSMETGFAGSTLLIALSLPLLSSYTHHQQRWLVGISFFNQNTRGVSDHHQLLDIKLKKHRRYEVELFFFIHFRKTAQ